MPLNLTLEVDSLRVAILDDGKPVLEAYDASDGTWDEVAAGPDVAKVLDVLLGFVEQHAKKGA